MPDFEGVTHDDFWPTVERLVARWAAAFDASSDLFQAAFQLTEAQRRSARFAPMMAKGQTLYRTLIRAGQPLGCIRRDLSEDLLVRLLEANDVALDAIFLATHEKVTRANLRLHVHLVFDTFRRLLVAEVRSTPRGRRRE